MRKSRIFRALATSLMGAAVSVSLMSQAAAGECWVWISEYPQTTVYELGESFRADGGKLTVHSAEGTNTVVDFTSPEVTMSQVDMTVPGKQMVNVSYGGTQTSFIIYINQGDIPEEPQTESVPEDTEQTQPESTPGKTEEAQPVFEDDSDKKVVRLTLKQEPSKTTYFVGDAIDYTGGILEATYNDKSKAEIPFSHPAVECDNAQTSKAGQLKVNVSYRGKRTTLTLSVLEVGGIVTFVNDGIVPDITQNVGRGMSAAEPEVPNVEGYTFGGWFADEERTVAYDFSKIVSEDRNVYAYWMDNNEQYCSVTYDRNYYGVVPQTYTQTVKAGDSARPIQDPQRDEFTFEGWFTDEACTAAYQAEAVESDTTLFAKWVRTTSGAKEYIFEAENVDMNGQTGPGMSNEAGGSDMIVSEADKAPSGGKFLSFLYKMGITVSFHITSDEAVEDATVAFSLAAELPNIQISPDNYIVRINGQDVGYDAVSIENGAPFADHIVLTGIALRKGYNVIELITNNSVNPAGGGTYAGTAPIVDCMKITSTSVLAWDGVHGLPMANQ